MSKTYHLLMNNETLQLLIRDSTDDYCVKPTPNYEEPSYWSFTGVRIAVADWLSFGEVQIGNAI